jgi:mannose-6-phosphate isomerase
LLEWFEARPGDTFFIPAGTVHAIGAGLTLCEIQQWSDVTYRLYDYGRPRELHLDEGVRVSRLGPHAARQSAREGVLVSCAFFTTEKVRVDGSASRNASMIVVLEGTLKIEGQPAKAGEVWYTDAGAIELQGRATVLLTR